MSSVFPTASRLGFGCASLGSRVGARQGLRAAATAFEQGVNWFDLAPSYGDGNAEPIFADFAASRRDRIHICTKCGIAPARIGAVASVLRPVAGVAVRVLPGLRRFAARGRATEPKRLPLTAGLIRESLDASLKRLRTDYVDVLALHDPFEDDLAHEEIAQALQQVVQSGKARSVGIAGSPSAIRAGLAADLPLAHIQLADGPGLVGLPDLRRDFAARLELLHVVTHSVFSVALARLEGQNANETMRAAALDYALRNNAGGTVLLSMSSPRHIAFNVSRLVSGEHSEINRHSAMFKPPGQ